MKQSITLIFLVIALAACQRNTNQKGATTEAAPFSADSAYAYVAAQCDFGPRYLGAEGHFLCAKYLESELRRHGAMVSIQQGQMPDYAGNQQSIYNIIGSFNPEKKNRILLCAHWDTRPWADEEEEYDLRRRPIIGANDGASGVGVLLEIARQLGLMQTTKGIDIVFFDAEDMGTPTFYTGKEREHTWCLGSQLWAKEQTHTAYHYGILLDMVGAPDATFHKEYFSMQYASNYVEKIWHTAIELGYAQYFRQATTYYPITDDHYYVNLAGIPCVDIIHYNPNTPTGFAPWWHTQQDDMRNISPATLDAVGKVVLTTILK